MKKVLFAIALLASVMTAAGKTTYIPTYRSYMHIVNGSDTIAASGNLTELELADAGGMFTLWMEHEELTKEKIKRIKRMKMAAGFAAFATVMSGTSVALSQNGLQRFVRSVNTAISADIAAMYAQNANEEQTLEVSLWIENTSGGEIMVNDMERGLTWYIRPGEQKQFRMNNPDAALLRISDTHNNVVRYATAIGGSSMKKWPLGWEDDDCWVVEVRNPKNDMLNGYMYISKEDYGEMPMSIDAFDAFYSEKKKQQKK